MNYKEYLFVCLSEELSEAQQEISKCLRFTPTHFYEPYGNTNIDRVQLEMADVYAIADLLKGEGIDVGLDIPTHMPVDMAARFLEKKERTKTLAVASWNMGAITDPPDWMIC